jgi:hypothetical protein
VLHLFSIEYHPAAFGTDGESLFTLHGTAGGRFAKADQNKEKAPSRRKGLFPVKESWRRGRWRPKAFTKPGKIFGQSGKQPVNRDKNGK